MDKNIEQLVKKEAEARYEQRGQSGVWITERSCFMQGAKFRDSLMGGMKEGSESGAGMKEALEQIMGIINEHGYDSGSLPHKYSKIEAIARKALSSQQEQEPDLSALEKLSDRERKSVIKYFKVLNKGI